MWQRNIKSMIHFRGMNVQKLIELLLQFRADHGLLTALIYKVFLLQNTTFSDLAVDELLYRTV